MGNNLEKKVVDFLKSENGKGIKILISYAITKTVTEKDDEIIQNIDDVVQIIANNIKDISELKPTDKDAKTAVMTILKSITNISKNKWDNVVYRILKIFV